MGNSRKYKSLVLSSAFACERGGTLGDVSTLHSLHGDKRYYSSIAHTLRFIITSSK